MKPKKKIPKLLLIILIALSIVLGLFIFFLSEYRQVVKTDPFGIISGSSGSCGYYLFGQLPDYTSNLCCYRRNKNTPHIE